MAEIGCRASHIVDIAFKILFLYHLPGLFYQGTMASGLYDSSLVEGQRTEITAAEASSAAD